MWLTHGSDDFVLGHIASPVRLRVARHFLVAVYDGLGRELPPLDAEKLHVQLQAPVGQDLAGLGILGHIVGELLHGCLALHW